MCGYSIASLIINAVDFEQNALFSLYWIRKQTQKTLNLIDLKWVTLCFKLNKLNFIFILVNSTDNIFGGEIV